MAELPQISVVTPSFNSVATIDGTIQSVLSQDYTNWEHIVVDGGSQDGTVAVLERHPGLKWVSEKDEGHYHAMNKGIARATGDVIVILNADDCFRPGALRKVAAAFQSNPAWDALFGDVVFVDGEGREIYRPVTITRSSFTGWITSATRPCSCARRSMTGSAAIGTRSF